MNISEAVSIIDGTKCPICGKTITVAEATDKNIKIRHDSLNKTCDEFSHNLQGAYFAAIQDNLSVEKLKSVAGKK